MSNYLNVFGGATVPPSDYRYQTLALTGNVTLFWSYNYTGSGGIVAKLNTITSTGAYSITMPDATLVSNGEDMLWNNTSAYTITLLTSTGTTIGTIAAGVNKYVWVADNTTATGTWQIITYGTGTSAADASALAGYGTIATGSTLSGNVPVTTTASNATATTASRGGSYVFTGGSVAFTLPAAVTATSGFYVDVKNAGTGTVTITPVGGDLVDANATLGLNPNESCRLECSGSAWYSVGLGRSTVYQFTKLVKDLTGLTAYTMTSADASNKLLQFTGAPSGAATITVPAVVAIYYVQISTSNAYTVTLKTSGGTGPALAQSTTSILYCDGVNVVNAQTASTPAASITVNNDTATNASMYPLWVTANSGNLPTFVTSTKFSFNPSTGAMTILSINGLTTAFAPQYGGTGVLNNSANTITFSGNYGLTLTLTGTTSVTLPTSGTVAVLGTAQTWTAVQTFTNSDFRLLGSSTGYSTFTSANAGASNYTITIPAVTDTMAVLGANTFTAEQTFVNTDWLAVDKGNINNATVTFTVSAGMIQTYTATGSTVTIATAGWPTTGHLGELLIVATNAGAYTHAWPAAINWIKPDGTTTTSIATYLAANTGRTALQSSGVDQIALWSRDAGTTIYGKLV